MNASHVAIANTVAVLGKVHGALGEECGEKAGGKGELVGKGREEEAVVVGGRKEGGEQGGLMGEEGKEGAVGGGLVAERGEEGGEKEGSPARGGDEGGVVVRGGNEGATDVGRGGIEAGRGGIEAGRGASNDSRRNRRLLRNRVNAQQARERKRQRMESLEEQCLAKKRDNEQLELRIAAVQQENDRLRDAVISLLEATSGLDTGTLNTRTFNTSTINIETFTQQQENPVLYHALGQQCKEQEQAQSCKQCQAGAEGGRQSRLFISNA
ncbi:unnamed protein product [Closterium sp. Yama58-4]|nr:unnamed protein product [Closterium sp. Yama58-4]